MNPNQLRKLVDLNQSAVDEEFFPKNLWRKMVVRAIDQLEVQYGYWKGDHLLSEKSFRSIFTFHVGFIPMLIRSLLEREPISYLILFV